jgi:hypothetical protein
MDSRWLEAFNKELNALLNEPLEDFYKEVSTNSSHIVPSEIAKHLPLETPPFGSQVTEN